MEVITKRYAIYNSDCCQVLPKLPVESVGLSVFSPPFSQLYSYSDHPNDMANCRNYEEFFEHFGFLVKELLRLTMPGRIVAVHCMDLPTFKSSGEEIGRRDFPGDIINCFCDAGFVYHSRVCIWKDPLIAATRTKAIGLAHKQIVKDSAICSMGTADYIVAFRKKGDNPKPIPHKEGLTTYHGAKPIPHNLERFNSIDPVTGEPYLPKRNKRSHYIWQRYASPVWEDIRQGRVLPYREARDGDDERHICPLQLDVIYRCLELWSTQGDSVLDPFLGVGSTIYGAVRTGRKGIGVELKPSYFRQAIRNVRLAEKRLETSKQ